MTRRSRCPKNGGIYTVAATFTVPQAASFALAVLTDYDQIPRFMPDVRTSTVLERGDDRTVVEQEAVARFMMFSKRVHLVLEVHEEPGTIRFRDRCGKSFARYEGVWTITESGTDRPRLPIGSPRSPRSTCPNSCSNDCSSAMRPR